MKPHLGGLSRCLYREATGGKPQQLLFRASLQLFVPFAQKDARLAFAQIKVRPNLSGIWEMKA
jgi:hypothetical protein